MDDRVRRFPAEGSRTQHTGAEPQRRRCEAEDEVVENLTKFFQQEWNPLTGCRCEENAIRHSLSSIARRGSYSVATRTSPNCGFLLIYRITI